ARHGQARVPVRLTTRAWYNPNLETRWHMIPALIGTLTLLQTLLLTALSVAREREQGTFDQLLVTPFRPAEIMAGKALPSMLVGIVQPALFLLVAQLWFRIPFAGSFFTLYAGLTVFLLAAVGIGLLLSSVAATMQQAMLYSFMLIMPFALLSGLTTPISSMPEVLQYLTLINPLRYAIDMAHRVYLEGVGLRLLFPELWPLAIMAVVTLSVASWMFRHRLAVTKNENRQDKKEREMNNAKLIHRFRLAAVGLIFLAAGCAVGPNYQKPELPVPADWQEAQQKGVDGRSAELARWWSTFNDPLLDSLVERAVRSNLDLRLAEARIREA